jgi:GDPmannose 4,6-dehydratase
MYAYWITVNYREAYHIHASNGILFNHESPIRGETFLTRKVTRAISRIAMGVQEKLYVGNLSGQRDWGHAKDYIRAMYLIVQQDEPSDYVIATGVTTTIRDFIIKTAAEIGLEVAFRGEGTEEKGFIVSLDEKRFSDLVGTEYAEGIRQKIKQKTEIVGVDKAYFRPTEVDLLIGDATKARTRLGWEPKYDLAALITDMMQGDVKLVKKEVYLKKGGFYTPNYFE